MKCAIRILFSLGCMIASALAGGADQHPVTSANAAILLAASGNPATSTASDMQLPEQAPPSENLVPQSQPWVDSAAIAGVQDVLFEFDVSDVVTDQAALQTAAQWLKDHPGVKVNLAGYADPRGDVAYNLALADNRAKTVKQKLIEMGVPEERIDFATGWGKLYRNCLEDTEECWKQNRRVQMVYANSDANTQVGAPKR